MRFPLSLLLLSLFAPDARAEANAFCRDGFAELMGKWKKAVIAAPVDTKERLAKAEQISVKEIFPKAKGRKKGPRVAEGLAVTQESMRAYKHAFDDLWNARVSNGVLPKWELSRYREWLKAQNSRPYPNIDRKSLHELYYENPIADYFDDEFLDYLQARTGANFDSIEDYVSTLDKSMIKNLSKALFRRVAKSRVFLIGTGAATVYFLNLINESVNSSLDKLSQILLGQTLKELFSNQTKNLTEQAVSVVRDWGKLFVGGEEKYVETVTRLEYESYAFQAQDINKLTRADGVAALEKYNQFTTDTLPLFHPLVMSEQKDFEEIFDKRLQEFKGALPVASLEYQNYLIALNSLRAEVEKQGTLPSAEQLELLDTYAKQIKFSEEVIVNMLADWLFYKQARGPDKPLDSTLRLAFRPVYEKYLLTGDLELLKRALLDRTRAHITQLQRYSNKVAGKKVAESKAEQSKPEDQIPQEEEKPKEPNPLPPEERGR